MVSTWSTTSCAGCAEFSTFQLQTLNTKTLPIYQRPRRLSLNCSRRRKALWLLYAAEKTNLKMRARAKAKVTWRYFRRASTSRMRDSEKVSWSCPQCVKRFKLKTLWRIWETSRSCSNLCPLPSSYSSSTATTRHDSPSRSTTSTGK